MHSQLTTPPSSIAASQSHDCSPNSSRRRKNRCLSPKPYGRQRVPSNDDSSPLVDDELRAVPRIPPVIKNLSYFVKHADSQLRKSSLYSDLGGHGQESKESLDNGLRFISIPIVTQAIIVQQAKREWQRVLALATAWEVETDMQRATLAQLILQQDAIEYARSSAELTLLKNIVDRRGDMEYELDIDVKKKQYQCDVLAFAAADSQLDHAEDLARTLWQPEKDATVDDITMEGKAPESELEGRLPSDSEPEPEPEFHD